MMSTSVINNVLFLISPPFSNEALNELFMATWLDHSWCDFAPILNRSLAYVCAYLDANLVGFVNLAWDGGSHAFLLDTTVHPEAQRRGIGRELVRLALITAQTKGVEWVHVDFEPHLEAFYHACGFNSTQAGLINLKSN